MIFKKHIKRVAEIILLTISALVIYYGFVLHNAREYTVNTILPEEDKAHYPLQLSDLSPRQLDILLKVEDPRFFEHEGIDFITPGAGITTITQSLVKHLYFAKFKPGIAKIKQTLIAYYVLDPHMSKVVQLTRFINTIYLGKDCNGFAQAAEYYFNTKFDRLTEDQFISLVAMIIAPVSFNVQDYPARNRERSDRIKMLISGKYKPKGLFDMYYGKMDEEAQKDMAPASYFEWTYE